MKFYTFNPEIYSTTLLLKFFGQDVSQFLAATVQTLKFGHTLHTDLGLFKKKSRIPLTLHETNRTHRHGKRL